MLLFEKKLFVLYIIFLIIFILFTNTFYTFDQTLILNQHDGLSYMNIANSSYNFSQETLHYHHAQRFYLPYLIGLIGNTLNVDNYHVFRVFVYLSIMTVIIFHSLIIFESKCSLKSAIIVSSLVFLNPYLIRFFISVPTMINDIFFLAAVYIFIYGLFKKNFYIILGTILSLISRQTGLFLFIGCIFYLYKNKMFREILYVFVFFILILFLSNFYAQNTSVSGFNFKHLWGLFFSIYEKDLMYTVKWLLLPLYGYIPLILFAFTRKKIFIKNINTEKIILIFIFLSTTGISILAGPDMAIRNVIRQTVIVMPVLLIFFLYYSVPNNNKNNFLISEKVLLVLIFISSFHPVYSKIKIFESLRAITKMYY